MTRTETIKVPAVMETPKGLLQKGFMEITITAVNVTYHFTPRRQKHDNPTP